MGCMNTTTIDAPVHVKRPAPVWASAMMLVLGLPAVWALGSFWLMLGVAVLWGVLTHVLYDDKQYAETTIPDDMFRAAWWRVHWLDVAKGLALIALLAAICIGLVAWLAGTLILALLLPLGVLGAVVVITT